MIYAKPRLFILSDTAYSVEFGDEISDALRRRVAAMVSRLDALGHPAIVEVVPSYRAVMVEYDPFLMDYAHMAEMLTNLAQKAGAQPVESGREVELPVCYGGSFGPDLETVATHNGLDAEEVIEIHSAGIYPVYMMGFSPGFPYLGGMDKRIATPRLSTPRTGIPAGSVGIAGSQTGVYPLASPGGWQLIGRTPLKLFDPTAPQPFLLAVGDVVRFVPITEEEYHRMGGQSHD